MVIALILLSLWTLGQSTAQPVFKPEVGQGGKDAVWVPTSPALVEKMLDLAKVTPDDLVMDLGSGDGRMVIAAARRGARAVGVEYNPEMVKLSRQLAREAGVDDRATFVEGDMYEADISKATVLALFLLTENLERLEPKFRALHPGTRIVVNTFGIPDWKPDATDQVTDDCMSWCTALLYVVKPPRYNGVGQTHAAAGFARGRDAERTDARDSRSPADHRRIRHLRTARR
jgi:SAM-dependent methyltransferase